MFRSINIKTALLITAIALLQGCAAAPQTALEPVFFPPAPNPPRIQYLTSINDSTDIEGKSSSFSLFLFGSESSERVRTIFKPYGIHTDHGKIYVCDIGAGNVVIIDPAAKSFRNLKGNYSLGKLKKPANLTTDKEGRLYVADAARKEVVVFSPEGDFQAAYGKELGMKPAAVAVDDKFLYVLDLAANHIKVLDRSTGKHLRSIGQKTETEEGVSMSTGMHLGPDGNLYLTNMGTGKVLKLDRDGHLLKAFGEMGDFVGKFARPKGIAVDKEGKIFIVDNGHQNIQVFNADARILIFFGDPGLPRGSLNLPVGISVTRENIDYFSRFADPSFAIESLVFVANQYGQDKLSVYGLGQLKQPQAAAESAAGTGGEPQGAGK